MPGAPARPIIRDGVLILPVAAPEDSAQIWSSARIDELGFLAAAYLDGVRRVLALDNVENTFWISTIARFDALLSSRDLPKMVLRRVGPASRAAGRILELFDEADRTQSRRRFLKGEVEESDRAVDFGESLVELQRQNAKREGALFAAAPIIDTTLCTGCDGCIRVCPSDALRLIKDAKGREVYDCDPALCDACGLCEGVCSIAAIGLRTMTKLPADVPLVGSTCKACGVDVHVPEGSGQGRQRLCRVCAHNGHHKKLFQVLS